jgi:hypothetical protein
MVQEYDLKMKQKDMHRLSPRIFNKMDVGRKEHAKDIFANLFM